MPLCLCVKRRFKKGKEGRTLFSRFGQSFTRVQEVLNSRVLGAVDARTELLLYFTPVVMSQLIIIGCVILAIIINCGALLSYS